MLTLCIHCVSGGLLQAQTSASHFPEWNLKEVYASDSLWDMDYAKLELLIPKFKSYQNQLFTSPDALLSYMQDLELSIRLRSKMYMYTASHLNMHVTQTFYIQQMGRIEEIDSYVEAAISFFEPELIAFSEIDYQRFMSSDKRLYIYKHYFDAIRRSGMHSLIWEQEEIVSLLAPVSNIPYNTYSILINTDFNKMRARDTTYNRISTLLYQKHSHLIASLLNGVVTINRFNASIREYASPLEHALSIYNIPITAYSQLIDGTKNNLTPLQDFLQVKATKLKKDSLTLDDILKTNAYELNVNISFDSASKIIIEATKILGKEYTKSMEALFSNGWIHVNRTKDQPIINQVIGATTGHPFIILNWYNSFDDLFSLIDLSAIAVYNNYSTEAQPAIYAYPHDLTKGVAACVNKIIVIEYLIKNAKDPIIKKYLIERYANMITNSFYRLVMLAEFEKKIYVDAENGESLSEAYFCDLMTTLQQKYFGTHFKYDPSSIYYWTQLPNLFLSFVNYTYAIDLAVAFKVTSDVKVAGDLAVRDYLNFLMAGSSQDPVDLIARYQIDLTSTSYLTPVFSTLLELSNSLKK